MREHAAAAVTEAKADQLSSLCHELLNPLNGAFMALSFVETRLSANVAEASAAAAPAPPPEGDSADCPEPCSCSCSSSLTGSCGCGSFCANSSFSSKTHHLPSAAANPADASASDPRSSSPLLLADVAEHVTDALVCCQQMSLTLQSFLDLKGLELGILSGKPTASHAAALLEQVAAQVNRAAVQRGLELIVEVEPSLEGVTFALDGVRVCQILAKCGTSLSPPRSCAAPPARVGPDSNPPFLSTSSA